MALGPTVREQVTDMSQTDMWPCGFTFECISLRVHTFFAAYIVWIRIFLWFRRTANVLRMAGDMVLSQMLRAARWYRVLSHFCFVMFSLVFKAHFGFFFLLAFVSQTFSSFLCDRVNSQAAKTNGTAALRGSIGLRSTPGEIPHFNLPELSWSARRPRLRTLWDLLLCSVSLL